MSDTDEDSDESVSSDDESFEEVYASDGIYIDDTSYLCLVGLYHSSSIDTTDRKRSYDGVQLNALNQNKNSNEQSNTKKRSKNKPVSQSRVLSGSTDPAILKEQVLAMLFDSVWPQVINVVGGLVQRYAAHLIANSTQYSSSAFSREPSSRGSRSIGGFHLLEGR